LTRSALKVIAMDSRLYPEDSAEDYRSLGAGDSTLEGDDVIVIRAGGKIDRLGLPQVWENRHLLKFFVLRSIRGRYRPTALGYGWIIFRPLLLCLVYVGVFGYMLGVKTDPVPFPLFVFLGISLYLFFSGTVSDTASSLTNNAGILSKVYYPRLIVPLTSLFVNVMDLLASLAVIAGLMLIYGVYPGWNFIYFPLFLGGLGLASFVLGLILAARSIESRDIMMALPVIMRVMIYAMPCVYPVSMVPEKLVTLYYLNPMASLIQGVRWSLWGEVPPPAWSVLLAAALIALGAYYALLAFTRAERTMVDSL
jgi:lipopolysaccharide transport system permease protein